MTNRTAATRYARAMLDVAVTEQVDLATIDAQLTNFASLVAANEPLRRALLSPTIPAPNKRAVVAELVSRAVLLPIVAKTLLLLAERDRLALVPDLAVAFNTKLLDRQNIVRAEVTTAQPLSADRLQAIQSSLAAATGRTVDITSRVDPSIIGGMIARVGGTVFDASVTSQLQRLRQRLDASI